MRLVPSLLAALAAAFFMGLTVFQAQTATLSQISSSALAGFALASLSAMLWPRH
jgi:hypothetical protein